MQRSTLARFAVVITLFSIALLGTAAQSAKDADKEQRATALVTEYKAAWQGKDWPRALTAAKELVQLYPAWRYLRMLADAQLMTGAYQDALATYDRAIPLAEAEKPTTEIWAAEVKDDVARLYTNKGNALLKLHRNTEAVAAYNKAAAYSTTPAVAYFNICATQYNSGDMEGAVASCRKCLALDPARADAYFILGSVLFADSKTDRNGKFIVPPEAITALRKYLELAPNGPHVADVKAMLEMAK